MTREEIIRLLENADVTVYERPQTRTAQAIEEAIKLIKQEPKTDVLKQIRAEIAEKENKLGFDSVSDVALKTAYIEVLKIIDKALKEVNS